MARIICGVDVSSLHLEARIGRDGVTGRFENTTAGIAALADFCHHHEVELVAVEATGGYEQQAFLRLGERSVPVAILNPRSVRRFAEAMGRREKTDRLDAGMIAWFAEVKQSKAMAPPPSNQQQLRALVTRLRQLTEVRTAQRNQARLVTDQVVLAMIEELQSLVARQIRELEQAIAEQIAADPFWSQLEGVFGSIKGVAERTVARLLAEMPEIGAISHKTISKLAGVAPLAHDSGNHEGKRKTRGGRASVREILFVVASVVARHEPEFQLFQQRLQAAGKPPKVIRIALAHKLLVRLNAKAREVRQQMAELPSLVALAPS